MVERLARSPSIVVLAALLVIVLTAGAVILRPTLDPPSSGPSRSARLVVDDSSLWAGHTASRTVTRLTLPDGARAWQTDVGCEPATLARAASRLFVSCFDSGEIVVLDAGDGAVRARSWVGRGPFGVLVSGARLYVTLAHENALLALRTDTFGEVARTGTDREPRGIALRGDRLYVVHLLDAAVRVFDAAALRPLGRIDIGQQAAVAEGLTPHPLLPRLYVPHQRMVVTNLARQFDNTVFPLVSALDTEELVPVRREALALDSVDTPVGLPLAAVLSADGSRLYTVNAASDDVSVVDVPRGIGVGHVVVGEHPRDLALSPDGGTLYTLNDVSDDVTVVDTATLAVRATLALARDPRPAAIRLGERIFTTSRPATIARDHWIACASCHLDGGFDGQTWLGTDEGPRNTPTLRGIAGTEPLHWSGTRPDVQSFQKTFTGLMGGTGLSPTELDALAAFVGSLRPIASPRRSSDGGLTPAAVAGAAVFRSAGCASCHAPPLFTDRQLHDVGTGSAVHGVPEGQGPRFKTPALRELWDSSPYLHDGRAPSLRDAIAQHTSARLSEADADAIVAFLQQLPLTDAEAARLFPR